MTSSIYGAGAAAWRHFAGPLALGTDLLPVVSNPSAMISARSNMKALGKTPSVYNAQRQVVGIPDWTRHRASSRDLETWLREPDYGICVQTREVRALDVDIVDEKVAASVHAFLVDAMASMGVTLPRRFRKDSPKFLMPFRLPGDLPKRQMETSGGMIEFLGTGQQFVALGRHRDGAAYEWEGGLPDEIPSLSLEQFDQIWADLTMLYCTGLVSASRREPRRHAEHLALDDGLADFLVALGLAHGRTASGAMIVECPWESEHTGGVTGDSSTVYFPAGTNGYLEGRFHCKHSHCASRRTRAFADAVGFDGVLPHTAEADFGLLDDLIPGSSETALAVSIAAGNAPLSAAATAQPHPSGDHSAVATARAPAQPAFQDIEVAAENVFVPGDWGNVSRTLFRQHLGGPDAPRVRKWNGAWYKFLGTHWDDLPDDELQALVHRYLLRAKKPGKPVKGQVAEAVPFLPVRSHVDETIFALRTLALLTGESVPMWDRRRPASHIELPQWSAVDTISMRNGLFHLPTRELCPHTPSFFALDSLPFEYDPHARCPNWVSFLDAVFPGDAESRDALQDFFGYLLTNDTSLHKILYLVGPPRSGKGTIGRVMEALLGRCNVVGATLASLATQFGLQPLIGRRAAIIGDARGGGPNSQVTIERLLTISGGDVQSIDRKNRGVWEGRLGTRIVIMSNEALSLPDASGALASRMVLLKFTTSFLGREDLDLSDRLLAELPGIFNWALAGLDRLKLRRRFVQPSSAKDDLDNLGTMNSPISLFVREHCVRGDDCRVSKDELFASYRSFCAAEGRSSSDKSHFMSQLLSAVPGLAQTRPVINGARVQMVAGLRLREEFADLD